MGGSAAATSGASAATGASSAGAAATAGAALTGVGTVVAIGATVNSLLNKNKSNNAQLQLLKQQQENAVNNKKNLLEKQLATRRANLGAMGVSMSGSATTSQDALIDDAYQDIYNTNDNYDYQYKKLYDESKSELLDGIMGMTNKTLV